MMTSHEYAKKLNELAAWLGARAEFATDYSNVYMFIRLSERDQVVEAVRACGSGKKDFSDTEFCFTPDTPENTQVTIKCPRNKVCTLVSPAKYDCEPLLTPEEAAAL